MPVRRKTSISTTPIWSQACSTTSNTLVGWTWGISSSTGWSDVANFFCPEWRRLGLDFAEIAVPTIRVQAIEAQVAEKLHAYTRPRPLENTRVRDLPDLALLASLRPIEAGPLMLAVTSTFSARNTHPLPDRFPSPPSTAWARPYASLAIEHDLRWKTLEEVTLAVRAFLDPVLAGEAPLTWSPVDWLWLAA